MRAQDICFSAMYATLLAALMRGRRVRVFPLLALYCVLAIVYNAVGPLRWESTPHISQVLDGVMTAGRMAVAIEAVRLMLGRENGSRSLLVLFAVAVALGCVLPAFGEIRWGYVAARSLIYAAVAVALLTVILADWRDRIAVPDLHRHNIRCVAASMALQSAAGLHYARYEWAGEWLSARWVFVGLRAALILYWSWKLGKRL